jgi:threonine dehydrogenase-like Zn-dependent dehydrogenase
MESVKADFSDGFEVVIPCLLDGNGMADALDCTALGGRIVMYGCIGTCEKFDFFKMHRKRAEIYSTEPRRDVDMRRFFEEGARMVCEGACATGRRHGAAVPDALTMLLNDLFYRLVCFRAC